MKSIVILWTLVFGMVAATSPISKVIDLLSSLESKIASEGAAAQKAFEEYSEWCEDGSKNLDYEIKTGKNEIADLTANIDQQSANANSLSNKVDELAASLTADNADLEAATQIRKKEAADFAAEEKELVEIKDTLERAIGLLEREMKKRGASALQWGKVGTVTQALTAMVQASVLSSADATRLTSLVQSSQQQPDELDSLGAPAAAVYEGHSDGIIETLEDLLDKAQTQLGESRKAESSALHNFNMLSQSLDDSIKFAKNDMSDAKKNCAETGEKKATAQGDLAVTSKRVEEDTNAKADLNENCMTKSRDFEAAKKSRSEELNALAEAKKAIADATAGAEAVAYGSFLQVASSKLLSSEDLSNFEAVRFVRDLARKEHAPALAQLASRMADAMRLSTHGGDGPFQKVKAMIANMIERLENDASDDANHKSYCDKELSESQTKKAEISASLDKVNSKIDQMTARSAQLKEEVGNLQKALAELAASQAEMMKMRQGEHVAFVKNKADMEQGLEGVKMGLKVLREYYATQDKAHDSADGAATSIVGLLEVVESDFSKGLAEMIATEANSEASYDQQTKESKIDKATKEQDVKYKSKEISGLAKTLADSSSDRTSIHTELDAVVEYLAKLEQMCVAKAEPYAERAARREAEIAGLKEAIAILEGNAALLQRTRSHYRKWGTLRGATLHKAL
jgi:chromosome segregation ATPase